jgi:hypothetical protein
MNEFVQDNMSLILLMGTQELQVQEAPSVRVFDDIQDLVQELVSISTPPTWAR